MATVPPWSPETCLTYKETWRYEDMSVDCSLCGAASSIPDRIEVATTRTCLTADELDQLIQFLTMLRDNCNR
jgi:non-ribosomal peptide synthetase component E (peptide arylation enzyme)